MSPSLQPSAQVAIIYSPILWLINCKELTSSLDLIAQKALVKSGQLVEAVCSLFFPQVQETFRIGSLDTLSTAVIRNFLLANGQKTSGTKEKIMERVQQTLEGQGQQSMESLLMDATNPQVGGSVAPSSQSPPVVQNGMYALPAERVQQFATQQL